MIKKRTFLNRGDIQCNSCGNYHYKWWMVSPKKMKKKIGCSSFFRFNKEEEVYQIYCSYGSGYDGDYFNVLQDHILRPNKPLVIDRMIMRLQKYQRTVICDKCIERFIHRKYIHGMGIC